MNYKQFFYQNDFQFFYNSQPNIGFDRSLNAISYNGKNLLPQNISRLTRQLMVGYSPFSFVQCKYALSQLISDTSFSGLKHQGLVSVLIDKSPVLTGKFSIANSFNEVRSELVESVESSIEANKKINFSEQILTKMTLLPYTRFDYYQRKTIPKSADSLKADSYHFISIRGGAKFLDFFDQKLGVEFFWQKDFLPSGNQFLDASVSKEFSLFWNGKIGNFLFGNANFAWRNRTFTKEFLDKGNVSSESLLLLINLRGFFLKKSMFVSVFYEASNERTSLLEKKFISVGQNQGEYLWRDFNQNKTQEQDEFILKTRGEIGTDTLTYRLFSFSSEELFPISKVHLRGVFRFKPRFLLKGKKDFLSKALSAIATETSVFILEKNMFQNLFSIFFFDFSKYQNSKNTILGNIAIRQVVSLFETEKTNFYFTFNKVEAFTKQSIGAEKRNSVSYGLRLFTTLLPFLSLDLKGKLLFHSALIEKSSFKNFVFTVGREFDIHSYFTEAAALFQIFDGRLNFKIGANYDYRLDKFLDPLGISHINELSIKATYEHPQVFKASIKFGRVEANTETQQYSYELLKGFDRGITYEWEVKASYNLSNSLILTLDYYGKLNPLNHPIHLLSAEGKIIF